MVAAAFRYCDAVLAGTVTLGTLFEHSAISLERYLSRKCHIWEQDMQSFAKALLWIVGCLSFLVALILALIVLDMIQHPRGIGMEWLAGPLVGLFCLAFITVAVVCIRVALALKKRPVPGGYAGGSEVVGRQLRSGRGITL